MTRLAAISTLLMVLAPALALAAEMLLSHIGQTEAAARMRRGILLTLKDDRLRTRDIGGQADTKTFTDGVITNIGHHG